MSAADLHRDVANVARFYKMALLSRALKHDVRREHELAAFLTAGADAAGEVAQHESELSLFYACVEGSLR